MSAARILIVDDEGASLEFLAGLLKQAGYAVFFAAAGAEALALLEKNSYDLVLLDIQMPGLDGFTVMQRLREYPEHRATPVIFLTGLTGPKNVCEAFDRGAADYITKPFSEREVLVRVELQIELKRHREKLEEKVGERTLALKETVKKLEQEVLARRETEKLLERKNIALQELISHLEEEKKRIRREITERIETLVLPLAQKLETATPARPEQIRLLRQRLDEIFAPYADRLQSLRQRLTPQEFEIADRIRRGASSKEVAELMGISPETVKWHRSNIRKKLELEARGDNLQEFLAALDEEK